MASESSTILLADSACLHIGFSGSPETSNPYSNFLYDLIYPHPGFWLTYVAVHQGLQHRRRSPQFL